MNYEEKIVFLNNYIKEKSSKFIPGVREYYIKYSLDENNILKSILIKKFEEENKDQLIKSTSKIFFSKNIAELLKTKIELLFKKNIIEEGEKKETNGIHKCNNK